MVSSCSKVNYIHFYFRTIWISFTTERVQTRQSQIMGGGLARILDYHFPRFSSSDEWIRVISHIILLRFILIHGISSEFAGNTEKLPTSWIWNFQESAWLKLKFRNFPDLLGWSSKSESSRQLVSDEHRRAENSRFLKSLHVFSITGSYKDTCMHANTLKKIEFVEPLVQNLVQNPRQTPPFVCQNLTFWSHTSWKWGGWIFFSAKIIISKRVIFNPPGTFEIVHRLLHISMRKSKFWWFGAKNAIFGASELNFSVCGQRIQKSQAVSWITMM